MIKKRKTNSIHLLVPHHPDPVATLLVHPLRAHSRPQCLRFWWLCAQELWGRDWAPVRAIKTAYDVKNRTCMRLWRKFFILLQEFIGFYIQFGLKQRWNGKPYSYWLFLLHCSTTTFVTVRSHSLFKTVEYSRICSFYNKRPRGEISDCNQSINQTNLQTF